MTARTVTQYEMDRRLEMAKARQHLMSFMSAHSLTPMEWVNVLNEMTQRMIAYGLRDDWADGENATPQSD